MTDDYSLPFELLPRYELQQCLWIGERISSIAADLLHMRRLQRELRDEGADPRGLHTIEPPHPVTVAMDIATVHLSQPLDLLAMLNASPDWLLSDYASIKKFLNRKTGTFPAGVGLRFRKSSGIIVTPHQH